MKVNDLNIETDILNIFNFTHNDDAKAVLRNLLTIPLLDKAEVIARQEILKGFLANHTIYADYSYSRIDYREIFTFLETFEDHRYLPKWLKIRLQFSRRRRYQYRSKCVQLILLYHRLHSRYISQVDLSAFPEHYKKDIRFINDYFNSFRLGYYENLIRTSTFGTKHMVQIMKIISKKKNGNEIQKFQSDYMLFEAYLSISLGIKKYKFNFPEIVETGVTLKDFYHPLLKNAVQNSFSSPSNVILLTGPNMSGKSTLLKAVGICIYLGNLGFAVPASTASMPLYDDISVFINLSDDLNSGYSHFMTEIMNLKDVVTDVRNGKRCFGIFDELFRGTNIDDALEISSATLKGLLNFPDSLFFISSHLHQITDMREVQSGQIAGFYLDCDLKDNTPAFTYNLKPGWSDIKIGRILFEKEGLNALLNNSESVNITR